MPTKTKLFNISIDESQKTVILNGEKCLYGIIQIGDFLEKFNVPVELWNVSDYKRQWREGLERLLNGALSTCVVTGMRDPFRGIFINTWSIYSIRKKVIIQNQILLCKQIKKRFTGNNFYDFIEPYENQTEDGAPISEWGISMSAVKHYYEKSHLCET